MIEAEYLIGIVVLLFLFMWYMGMFSKLEIQLDEFEGGVYIYYDYQGHINSVALFHENLQKEIKDVDFSKMQQLTIVYDDPFNLVDPRFYRASLGFLLESADKNLIDKFGKMGYTWRQLPKSQALSGSFPYRNKSSIAFGSSRFLPSCLQYLLRNQRSMKDVLKNMDQMSGTLELLDRTSNRIRYFMPIENQKEFYLTTKDVPRAKRENKYTNLYYKKMK